MYKRFLRHIALVTNAAECKVLILLFEICPDLIDFLQVEFLKWPMAEYCSKLSTPILFGQDKWMQSWKWLEPDDL